jgi:hypothetical protein
MWVLFWRVLGVVLLLLMLLPLLMMMMHSPGNISRRTKRDCRHAAPGASRHTPAKQLLVQELLTLLLLQEPSGRL